LSFSNRSEASQRVQKISLQLQRRVTDFDGFCLYYDITALFISCTAYQSRCN